MMYQLKVSSSLLKRYELQAIRPISTCICLQQSESVGGELPYEKFAKGRMQSNLKKETKPPFLKNILRGLFDKDVLAFPEPLSEEHLTMMDKNMEVLGEFVKTIDSALIDKNRKIPDNVIKGLKSLKLFGQLVPSEYGGLGYTYTEHARFNEILGRHPSVAAMLYLHDVAVISPLLQFGSEGLKDKYLGKLASGEFVGTKCFTETESGSDLYTMSTKATRSAFDWMITGSKAWVANADNADVFLVYASTKLPRDDEKHYSDTKYVLMDEIINARIDKLPTPTSTSVFVVEKSSPNIVIKEQPETLGMRGIKWFQVDFENTVVPDENLIGTIGQGYDIYCKTFSQNSYVIGSIVVPQIKDLLKETIDFSIKRKKFRGSLAEFGLTREKISRAAVTIYAIESMIYMTTGLLDTYANHDCAVESAAVKVYASEMSWQCTNELLQLLGRKTQNLNEPYERILRDSKCLLSFDSSNELNRLFIALTSLKDVGKSLQEDVRKVRNPFYYPGYNFMKSFRSLRMENDEPQMYLKLDQFLHPSLVMLANLLEYCVLKFDHGVKEALGRHGALIVDDQTVLRRIADIMISIYAMTAVLARTSRSYCTGLPNATEDLAMAEVFVRNEHKFVKIQLEELIEGDYFSSDRTRKIIIDKCYNNKEYYSSHPLDDNYKPD